MTKYIRSILCISDIHAGSPYAVSDEDPVLIKVGNMVNEVYPNEGQLEMYKLWKYMIKMAKKFRVDTVINLADTCDGCNPKEGGRSLMTPDIDAQKELAVRLLKPVVAKRRYISCTGSPYHQSVDSKTHKEISNRLSSVAKDCLYVGVTGILTIPEINKKISVAHKASAAMLYTATMADREMIYWNVAKARNQLPQIDWIIRGHLHRFYHLDNGREHFLQLPGWKAWFPIRNSTRMIGRYQPDIGFSIIQFDEAGRSHVMNFIYNAPNVGMREAIL